MIRQLSKELDFAYEQNGSLVLCFDEKDRDKLEELLHRGEQNGVEDLRIVEREELLKLEPEIGDQVVAALYVPTGGIVCPFGLTIALAENAAVNGVEFYLGTKALMFRSWHHIRHGQCRCLPSRFPRRYPYSVPALPSSADT